MYNSETVLILYPIQMIYKTYLFYRHESKLNLSYGFSADTAVRNLIKFRSLHSERYVKNRREGRMRFPYVSSHKDR
jgi:hypothetical protein